MLFSTLRNAYFSLFILFYNLGGRHLPAALEFDLYKGVIWQSIVMWFLFSSPLNVVPFLGANSNIYKFILVVLSIVVAFLNWYIIINSGAGSRFVRDFHKFTNIKKVSFYFTAIGITVFAGFLFYISGLAHRKAIRVE